MKFDKKNPTEKSKLKQKVKKPKVSKEFKVLMKQNSKFTPEVARILQMMDHKNKVPKKKLVKRYQLSKAQYYQRLEENNANRKPDKYIFHKDDIEKANSPDKTNMSEKSHHILPPAKSEASFNKELIQPPKPRKYYSRNLHSRVTMKQKTALSLLIDKNKESIYTPLSPKDPKFMENALNTQSIEEKSRLTFGNGAQMQTYNEKQTDYLSPQQSLMSNYLKTGSMNQEFSSPFHNDTLLS